MTLDEWRAGIDEYVTRYKTLVPDASLVGLTEEVVGTHYRYLWYAEVCIKVWKYEKSN